jgi:ArsR family transcriptional regulator
MSNTDLDLEGAARVFKALSNPHRLAIFMKLAGALHGKVSIDTSSEGFTQCQFKQAEALGIAPSTVSHHYKELRDAGLIRMERQGKSVICFIDAKTLEQAKAILGPELARCRETIDPKE